MKITVADEDFHRTIAEITQNEVILQMQKALWIFVLIVKCGKIYIFIFQIRAIVTFGYKIMRILLQPHREKDPVMAKKVMWQHLENVKQKLFEISDVDDPNFNGYLFNMSPIVVDR